MFCTAYPGSTVATCLPGTFNPADQQEPQAGTRIPVYPGTRVHVASLATGSENPRVLSSDPTRQTGKTRSGMTGYPGR